MGSKTKKSLADEVREAKEQIAELDKKSQGWQEQCSHPVEALQKTHHSSECGPVSEREFSTSFHCTICGKRWMKEGAH